MMKKGVKVTVDQSFGVKVIVDQKGISSMCCYDQGVNRILVIIKGKQEQTKKYNSPCIQPSVRKLQFCYLKTKKKITISEGSEVEDSSVSRHEGSSQEEEFKSRALVQQAKKQIKG